MADIPKGFVLVWLLLSIFGFVFNLVNSEPIGYIAVSLIFGFLIGSTALTLAMS